MRPRANAAGGWWSTRAAPTCAATIPGEEPTLIVESTVLALTEVWTGDRDADEMINERKLRVIGTGRDARDLWRWLGRSAFAETREVSRKAASV